MGRDNAVRFPPAFLCNFIVFGQYSGRLMYIETAFLGFFRMPHSYDFP